MEKIGQQGDHQAAGGIKKCAGKTCPKVGDVWYQIICNDLQKACVVNDFRCPNKYVRTLGIVTCPKIWHVRLFWTQDSVDRQSHNQERLTAIFPCR
jgi:hypothetical protein